MNSCSYFYVAERGNEFYRQDVTHEWVPLWQMAWSGIMGPRGFNHIRPGLKWWTYKYRALSGISAVIPDAKAMHQFISPCNSPLTEILQDKIMINELTNTKLMHSYTTGGEGVNTLGIVTCSTRWILLCSSLLTNIMFMNCEPITSPRVRLPIVQAWKLWTIFWPFIWTSLVQE